MRAALKLRYATLLPNGRSNAGRPRLSRALGLLGLEVPRLAWLGFSVPGLTDIVLVQKSIYSQ
jgi:hypothetical protein